MKAFFSLCLLLIGQILAWFMSNAAVIGGWCEENYIKLAVILSPFASLAFAFATKYMYESGWSLWSIRFTAFGIGYAVFIPLTWYFLGEEIFTLKNTICIALCITIVSLQFLLD